MIKPGRIRRILLSLSLLALTGLPFNYAVPQVEPTSTSALGQGAATSAVGTTAAVNTVVVIGDSLTDGYGVKREEAYPALLETMLNAHGHSVKVINGGISGSVTAGADQRVRWYARAKPTLLILALGANDALKGTPPAQIKKNLALAIDQAKSDHMRVVLCGMRIFTNFGTDYATQFETLFRELAREKNVKLLPFLLEGVALEKTLLQADGKHPNAKGHQVMAKTVFAVVEKLL